VTIMKAERLTGYQIRELRLERDNVTFGAFDCARCKARRPPQIHHRKFRSHGGTHQVDDLERSAGIATESSTSVSVLCKARKGESK
jgi:hypothetical protein